MQFVRNKVAMDAKPPTLKFIRTSEINDVTKYDNLLKLVKYYMFKYSKPSFELMLILQATEIVDHSQFFKTFRKRLK